MPRVPVHTINDAPEQSREALRGLERRMGRLLNIHAEMAHAPVVLAAYGGIQKAITAQGSFDARTREAIALAVGAVDKCAYCQSAHTAGGQAAGWSLEQTVAIRDGTADLGPKLGSLLAVAREIAGNTGYVADATWQAALEAGWSDAELAELFDHVATVAAASGQPLRGATLLAIYAAGMTVPLLALAAGWDRLGIGQRRWLRGNGVRVGPLHLHTTGATATRRVPVSGAGQQACGCACRW